MLIAGTVMARNGARESGGAVFDVVDTGWGALRFNESHLNNNVSGQFQNLPGVFYRIDGEDTLPAMLNSTDR